MAKKKAGFGLYNKFVIVLYICMIFNLLSINLYLYWSNKVQVNNQIRRFVRNFERRVETVKPFEDEPPNKRSVKFTDTFRKPRPHKLLEIHQETKIWEKFVEEVIPGVDLEKCPKFPPDTVGRTTVNVTEIKRIVPKYDWLQPGGHYAPPCLPQQTLALIIPYRNRPEQLQTFITHIHPFLKSQQLNYTIFVTEQSQDSLPFNKGQIMNTAYVEALKVHNFTCFVFHDVDLLPENDRNLYKCTKGMRHLSSSINKYRYRAIKGILVGGAVAVHRDVFRRVNGYSNKFWGWGGEDDDFKYRMDYWGVNITRNGGVGRYFMVKHKAEIRSNDRGRRVDQGYKFYKTDGLSNLNSKVKSIEKLPLYTRLLVQVDPTEAPPKRPAKPPKKSPAKPSIKPPAKSPAKLPKTSPAKSSAQPPAKSPTIPPTKPVQKKHK